jgi:hypothetical protein
MLQPVIVSQCQDDRGRHDRAKGNRHQPERETAGGGVLDPKTTSGRFPSPFANFISEGLSPASTIASPGKSCAPPLSVAGAAIRLVGAIDAANAAAI